MPGRIVVGVDGSETSLLALRWAADEARRREAALDVVYAWHFPYADAVPMQNMPTLPDLERVAHLRLESVLGAEGFTEADMPSTTAVVKEGATVPVLLEAAIGADLLVVGSHGYGRFRGMLLGSVSQHCVTHSPCSVAVVR